MPDTYRPLPVDENGTVQCQAIFGSTLIVEIEWGTDPDGNKVSYSDASNVTLHGPFYTQEEVDQWIADYPEFDDFRDYRILHLNSVR